MPDIRIANYRQEIEDALEHARSVDVATAFASEQGLSFGHTKQKLIKLLKNGGTLRVILDLKLANTDPEFLAHLLSLRAKGFQVECQSYTVEADGIFHPKVYIFSLLNGSIRVISGSANWTQQAYTTNVEHGFVIQGDPEDIVINAALAFFDALWNSPNAKRIDSSSLDIYRNYWRRRRGLDRKVRKRSGHLWSKLQEYLTASQPEQLGFQWPTKDVAQFLGCLAARGFIDRRKKTMTIHFRYGGSAYKHAGRSGYIGKGNISYKASQVVHLIPKAVASRISKALTPATTRVVKLGKWTYEIRVNCNKNPQLLYKLKSFFGDSRNYHSFDVPRQIFGAEREFQEEFMRGYALACGLVSDGTYDPTHNHQVWLRPATENTIQFDQLIDLLQKHLGTPAYVHRRSTRDVAIKIRCESWLDIGFDIDWLDAIVEEGARLNGALAPPQVS